MTIVRMDRARSKHFAEPDCARAGGDPSLARDRAAAAAPQVYRAAEGLSDRGAAEGRSLFRGLERWSLCDRVQERWALVKVFKDFSVGDCDAGLKSGGICGKKRVWESGFTRRGSKARGTCKASRRLSSRCPAAHVATSDCVVMIRPIVEHVLRT